MFSNEHYFYPLLWLILPSFTLKLKHVRVFYNNFPTGLMFLSLQFLMFFPVLISGNVCYNISLLSVNLTRIYRFIHRIWQDSGSLICYGNLSVVVFIPVSYLLAVFSTCCKSKIYARKNIQKFTGTLFIPVYS